ncbi:dATP/dGTP diphosphohydrolase domain-containing protein [Burkholderia ambifaria]|uniref:dATP/dGTP diphosphohydrolase domain-containing protein n=1 Tax=Burkholderia ambifaria TaxID=152480 RepID=UPI00158BCEE7|nr:dATP/dGTP diphosphohydrolase domain-containing protein [Burkholderia ambifaria]MBR8344677.1 hypothetical protein [Burkholderia ambifaria]
MSDASFYAAEWTKVGKPVIVLTTGQAGVVTGFYGMQYRLVRVGDTRTPLVVDLSDLGPADQPPGGVSRSGAVSRETESHVQHDSVPVEARRACTDVAPDQFREHWLEQTGNHRGAAPVLEPGEIAAIDDVPIASEKCPGKDPRRAARPGESKAHYEQRMHLMHLVDLARSWGWPADVYPAGIEARQHIPEDGKPTNPKDAIATDKLPLHLLSPFVKAYQAIAHYLGNVKYGAWNWRAAGIRISVYRAALDRHLDAFWEGEANDPTDGTPHLANAMCCLNIIVDAMLTGNVVDDRPPSNAARLAEVRAELEALMPKIRAKYADKHPRHFTIADTDELKRPCVAQPQGDAR